MVPRGGAQGGPALAANASRSSVVSWASSAGPIASPRLIRKSRT